MCWCVLCVVDRYFFKRAAPQKCAILKKVCAVLMESLCNSKAYYIMTQRFKKENSSIDGRFRCELIRETKS